VTRGSEAKQFEYVRKAITKLRPATVYQTPKRELQIGPPPRSAEMATTPAADTRTQAVRAKLACSIPAMHLSRLLHTRKDFHRDR
jgi:hypothetical protein